MMQLIKSWASTIIDKKTEVAMVGPTSPHELNEASKKSQQETLVSTGGSLGRFEELPKEILLLLITKFHPRDLYPLFRVSKKMNYFACHDLVWMHFFQMYCTDEGDRKKVPSIEPFTSWKSYFLATSYWKWATTPEMKADTITVTNNGKTASRPTSRGSNPAILAAQPLTRYRDCFELEIVERGNWLGIGFCDSRFTVHDGPTLGTQTHGCVNGSFFCQDSTSLRIHGCKDKISLTRKLQAKDRVKVKIDFDNNEAQFYRNGKLEGKIVSEVLLEEGKLYPCCNLSYGTTLTFVSDLTRE